MPARRIANLLWLLAVLAGTALRLYQLRDQVLVDDEWHALHALLGGGPLDVLLSFGASDHSIPLTLYDVLLERTVGLSELGMRLPSLLCGVAALVVVPWLARDVAGTRASVLLAWLLAIAPLHVFYSRYARPYEPAMLLTFVALLALHRWVVHGGRRWQVLLVACTIVAPWLLLLALPPIAAALLAAIVFVLAASRARSRVEAHDGELDRGTVRSVPLLRTVALIVAGWLSTLGPPLLASGADLADKAARGTIERATLDGASELLLGTTSSTLRVVLLGAALLGAVVLVRRRPRFAAYLTIAGVAQVAALLLLRPHGLRFAIVLARYLFVLSPFLLLLIALGLDAVDRALARMLGAPRLPLVSAAAVLALVLIGPLGWIYAWPNDFTNHGSYQADYEPGRYFDRFRPTVVSDFYTALGERSAGELTIVEAPWHFFWHSLAYTQRIHRQHVVVGFVDRDEDAVRGGEVPHARSGVRLRNALHVGDADALRARGVDYVVFHHDAHAEMRVPFPAAPVEVGAWIEEYRRTYGEPAYEDELITVFALR